MRILALFTILLLVAFMGCVGGPENGGQETTTQGNQGESPAGSTPTGSTPTGSTGTQGVEEWCVPGSSWTYSGTSEETPGSMSFEIKGFETYEGQEMCHAVAVTEQGGQKMQMDYYFDKNEEKVCYEMTDLNTNTALGHGCVTGGA